MKFRPSVAIIVWMLSIAASLAIVSSLGAQNSTTPASSAKRAITEKDLFDFVWVANPRLSSDGSRVAFTRVNVDDKRTGYETSIWMVATSGNAAPVRMTSGKHDAQPRWSPDGKQIAFTRGGDKDESGKPKPPQIALLSLTGGEAWIITDLPKGATDAVWSPDSKRIAFTSSTTPEDIEKAQHKKSRGRPSRWWRSMNATRPRLTRRWGRISARTFRWERSPHSTIYSRRPPQESLIRTGTLNPIRCGSRKVRRSWWSIRAASHIPLRR